MAGEIDTDLWLKVAGWGAGAIAYGSGLVMYVRTQLNAHSKKLDNHDQEIREIQRAQALAVRPQDIDVLRQDFKEIRSLLIEVLKQQK